MSDARNGKFDIRVVVAIAFVATVLLRLLPHAYHIVPVGAFTLFAACYFSAPIAAVLTLCAMAISDALGQWLQIPSMGFYEPATMLAVYAGHALVAVVGWALRGRVSLVSVPIAALSGTAVFFVVSNFACWLDPMMGYEPSLSGLGICYWNALPFARDTLIGNLLFTSLAFWAYHASTATNSAAANVSR